MQKCPTCGKIMLTQSGFCPNCGTSLKREENTEKEQTPQREVFYGQVCKCPSCGAPVPAMTAVCPECGHEFTSTRAASSINQFAERITEYDARIAIDGGWPTWGLAKKIGWVVLNVYLICIPLIIYTSKRNKSGSHTADKEKAAFVENYVFPNEKEAIVEALLFIKSQLTKIANRTARGDIKKWETIWMNKASQIHQKASIVLKGDHLSEQTYDEIVALDNQYQQEQKKHTRIVVAVVVVVIILTLIYGGSGSK